MVSTTTSDDVLELIGALVREILTATGANSAPELRRDTPLLDGSLEIDSLDLAGIVVGLEAETGCDPFAEGFVDFQTAGELADLFAST